MSPATAAACLTDDPELHERLMRELARCAEPERVLAVIDDLRSVSAYPLEGESLVRAVAAAVDRVAMRAPSEPRPRMKGFMLNPEAVLRDPAAQSMNELEWAAYSRLFCELWRQPEPGIAPDNDNALAGLAHLDLNTWKTVRPAVKRAFDTRTRPGYWVLQWMREALASQDQYIEKRREAGKKGAQVRAAKAAKRTLRLVDKQSLSAAQAIVDPGIRESGNPGIRSVGQGDGISSRHDHTRARAQLLDDDIPPPVEVADSEPTEGS